MNDLIYKNCDSNWDLSVITFKWELFLLLSLSQIYSYFLNYLVYEVENCGNLAFKVHRERQRVRAINYPFVKLMEIADSVHTGRVRQTRTRVVFKQQDFKFYNFTRAL